MFFANNLALTNKATSDARTSGTRTTRASGLKTSNTRTYDAGISDTRTTEALTSDCKKIYNTRTSFVKHNC